MKYTLLTFAIFSFISCKNDPNKKMIEQAKTYVLKNANNPNSFEFVDFKVIDTLRFDKTNDDYYKSMLIDSSNYAEGIDSYENGLRILDRAISEGNADKIDTNKGNDIRVLVENAKNNLDSISNQLKEHREKYFNKNLIRTEYKFRATNEMNAIVLYDKVVIFDENCEIIHFIDKI